MKAFLFTLLLFPFLLRAQLQPQEIVHFTDSMMNYGVSEQMIPGSMVTVVSSEQVYLSRGYGLANQATEVPVTAEETLFQLGSVGKVFTAIAALQQVERGKLDLYRDVNTYLFGWKIDNPYDSLTLFHLLTHTGGFNESFTGYMARSESEILPLSIHLPQNMPTLFQSPGTNINYSNYGYALAGHLVELSSEMPFDQYVRENILEELGMNRTTYHLPDHYQELSDYARGYQSRENFEELRSYPRHALPAGSLLANAGDMGRFIQHLLRKDTALLSTASYNQLFTQQFTNDPHLTGYTLGMEVQSQTEIHIFAKGGQVPGFLSLLLLIPEKDLGIFMSFNTETDNFLELFMSEFKSRFLPGTKEPLMDAISGDVSEYAGHYGNLRTSFDSFEGFFLLFQGHFQLQKTADNTLRAYHNGGWQSYQQVKENVFQHMSEVDQFITFQRNEKGKISNMYRSMSVGGIQIPSSYYKLSWWDRPRFLNDEYPIALLVILLYLLFPPVWLITFFKRKRNPDFLSRTKIPSFYHATAMIYIGLFFWNILAFFVPLLKAREAILFGLSDSLLSIRYFNGAMAFVSVLLILLSMRLLYKKEGNIWIRAYYTLYSLVAFSYVLILHRWHFLFPG